VDYFWRNCGNTVKITFKKVACVKLDSFGSSHGETSEKALSVIIEIKADDVSEDTPTQQYVETPMI
jgi:hypothetical protein